MMSDIEEINRLLGEAHSILDHRNTRHANLSIVQGNIVKVQTLLDNMEEPITERFQLQIDKYNEMIVILKEMKDMIEPTEEPDPYGKDWDWNKVLPPEEPKKGENQLHAGLEDGGLNLIIFDDEKQLREMLGVIGFLVDDDGVVTENGKPVICSGCERTLILNEIGHVMPPNHFYCSSSVCIMDYYERYGHLEEKEEKTFSEPCPECNTSVPNPFPCPEADTCKDKDELDCDGHGTAGVAPDHPCRIWARHHHDALVKAGEDPYTIAKWDGDGNVTYHDREPEEGK